MAIGDLVTADYMFEYNGIVIGDGTPYDLTAARGILGFSMRSSIDDRFGRHGAITGQMYAKLKSPQFEGNALGGDDTDWEAKRRAFHLAFAPTVDHDDSLKLVFQLPGAGATKVYLVARPLDVEFDIDRAHALKYAPFRVRMEAGDPIIYSLAQVTTPFTAAGDTETVTNNGNAPAKWIGTWVGPLQDPVVENNDTGQVISFNELVLGGGETLVLDSNTGTAKVNGDSVTNVLSVGFSWFDLAPGANSISVSAEEASTASFSITHEHAYWSP